jgi:hypothetical protein
MPKLPVDYSKTIIYKLVHKEDYDNVNIYIGSTTDLIKRKNQHKTSCNNEKDKGYNHKKYQYIRENGGWDEWNIIEIEKYPCNDGNEARAREEYWRCNFNSQLNSNRAYRTEQQRKEYTKEYYEKNKEKITEYHKQYGDKNKDYISKYHKQYKDKNKDYISEQKKEYYEQNRDKKIEQHKEYYEINKGKKLEKTPCECGCMINKGCLTRHLKSQKHLMKVGVLKYQFIDDKDDSTECITHQPLQLLLS